MIRSALGLSLVAVAMFFSVATSYVDIPWSAALVEDTVKLSPDSPFTQRIVVTSGDEFGRFGAVGWSGIQGKLDEGTVRVQLRDLESGEVRALVLEPGVESSEGFHIGTCGEGCERTYDLVLEVIGAERGAASAEVKFTLTASGATFDEPFEPNFAVERLECPPRECADLTGPR